MFSLKYEERDYICNVNKVGILKMKKKNTLKSKILMNNGLLNLGDNFASPYKT
jgi:hypothetical protein